MSDQADGESTEGSFWLLTPIALFVGLHLLALVLVGLKFGWLLGAVSLVPGIGPVIASVSFWRDAGTPLNPMCIAALSWIAVKVVCDFMYKRTTGKRAKNALGTPF